MPRDTGDIEEKDESLPRIMSMRRKVALGGFAFMFCVGAILLVSSPGIVESYMGLTALEKGGNIGSDEPDNIMDKEDFSALYQPDGEVEAELPRVHQEDEYETILFDDVFDGESWGGQKYTIRDGNVFLDLKPNSLGYTCSILLRKNFEYAGFEARLRVSSRTVPMLAMGFARTGSEVTFMWFSNKSSDFAQGLHAYCKDESYTEFWEPIELELDITEWHTYQVIWQPNNATFIVDGQVVAHTSKVPNRLMEVWIYSMCKTSDVISYDDLHSASCGDLREIEISDFQFTEIDYVRIFNVMGDVNPIS